MFMLVLLGWIPILVPASIEKSVWQKLNQISCMNVRCIYVFIWTYMDIYICACDSFVVGILNADILKR